MDSATMLHPQPLRTHITIGQAELESLAFSEEVLRAPPPSPEGQDPMSVAQQQSHITASPLAIAKEESTSPEDIKFSPEAMEFDGPLQAQWSTQPNMTVGDINISTMRYPISAPFGFHPGNFYPHARNGVSYDSNQNLMHTPQYLNASCPRSYPGPNFHGLLNDNMSASYPPAVLQIEPQSHFDTMSDSGMNDQLMQSRDDYEFQYGSNMNGEYHGGYNSSDSDFTRASTPTDDDMLQPTYSLTSGDEMVVDKEQPYAQLIYQALLQADNHTMILKDIYDWFLRYTDKATGSETKGWQNSIRHNLSMNGAFEKVDQPGDDARKGFMWRLTTSALRDGVKSTTRYRSKQPNKRGSRAHPQPQRQASGAKGGQAARRSANIKRSKRVYEYQRSEPYGSSSSRSNVVSGGGYGLSGEMSKAFSRSPFYDPSGEVEFAYNPPTPTHGLPLSSADFGSSHISMGTTDLFSPITPTTTNANALTPDSYVLSPHGPGDVLFTNSPTPSADEPRTPNSQGWEEDINVGFGAANGVEGMGMDMSFPHASSNEYLSAQDYHA